MPSPFVCRGTVLAALLAFAGMIPGAATAQDVPACSQVVDLAETLYEQARMDEVIALVSDCLSDEDVTVATAVRGYRIMALAFLRNDAVGDARLTIIELLGRDPTYQADPVQDLPAYVALVESIREQLSLPDPSEMPIDVVGADSSLMEENVRDLSEYQRTGDMVLRGRLGWSSYGGERGTTGGGFFGEFVDNGGESASIELAYAVTPLVGVGLQYQVARYPTILDAKGAQPTEDFPAIDKGTSSPWLHYVGILVRAALPTQSVVRPYALLGFYTSFGLLNDKVSVSGGPKLAVGVDVSVGPGIGLFLEVEEQLLLPGDGSDLTDRQYSYDLFSGAALGLRYSLTK